MAWFLFIALFSAYRYVPDLIQKLEVSCDTASDWLRSDKVYIEQVEKDIVNTRTQLKGLDNKVQRVKLDYENIRSHLKHKQMQKEEHDENYESAFKYLENMESRCVRDTSLTRAGGD